MPSYNNGNILPDAISNELLNMFQINKITMGEIEFPIRMLKPRKYPGPDGVPSYVVKGCIDIFKYPLHFIFNLSLKTCIFLKYGKKI